MNYPFCFMRNSRSLPSAHVVSQRKIFRSTSTLSWLLLKHLPLGGKISSPKARQTGPHNAKPQWATHTTMNIFVTTFCHRHEFRKIRYGKCGRQKFDLSSFVPIPLFLFFFVFRAYTHSHTAYFSFNQLCVTFDLLLKISAIKV